VIALAEKLSAENPSSEKSLLRCLNYFLFRNVDQFAPEVEKIYDAHSNLPKVALAASRYAKTMSDGYGSELVRKLSQLNDTNTNYSLHVRNLKNAKTAQLDRELFKTVLLTAMNANSDDRIALSDIINDIDAVNDAYNDDYSEIVSQFLDTLREYASGKNLALAMDNSDPDNISFGFYTATGDSGSATIDREQLDVLQNLAKLQIQDDLKRSEGQFNEKIRKEMDFWSAMAATDWVTDSRKVTAFVITNLMNVKFIADTGAEIEGSKIGIRAIITTQTIGSQINVVLKWNTDTGTTQSVPIKAIVNFKPSNIDLYKYLTMPPP
jgi:hypothetical protein